MGWWHQDYIVLVGVGWLQRCASDKKLVAHHVNICVENVTMVMRELV